MLVLHAFRSSGNGCTVRLPPHPLAIPLRLELHDIPAGATRMPAFPAGNPNGRIPLLVLDDGTPLAASRSPGSHEPWAEHDGSRP